MPLDLEYLHLLTTAIKRLSPHAPPWTHCAGEAEEEGYDDEYQLEDLEVTPADYIRPVVVTNFRKGWEELDASSERADDYGLGQREGLQVRHSTGGMRWAGSRTWGRGSWARDQGAALMAKGCRWPGGMASAS